MAAPRIVLIGAGNVGTHLGKRFYDIGIPVVQVFSRSKKKAKALAQQIEAKACSDLSKITPKADLYILAVHDGAIKEVAEQISFLNASNRLFVHTSGATPSTVFEGIFKNYGIFYPLQTFSVSRPADFSNIPICIDSKKKKSFALLENLAKLTSPKVYHITDSQRATLHVAAVIVNNFSNHLFHIGETICKEGKVSFDILRPLIQETAAKVQANSPMTMQTGPAKRGDQSTIERHLKYLEHQTDFAEIYRTLSNSIRASVE